MSLLRLAKEDGYLDPLKDKNRDFQSVSCFRHYKCREMSRPCQRGLSIQTVVSRKKDHSSLSLTGDIFHPQLVAYLVLSVTRLQGRDVNVGVRACLYAYVYAAVHL